MKHEKNNGVSIGKKSTTRRMVVFVRKMWNYERRVPLTGAAAIRTWREQRPCSADHTSTHSRTNEPLINEINFRINLS